ncbi:MAG TPA: class I SAM-dependent methyltransferase [Verrucomicrobiae bacterium]
MNTEFRCRACAAPSGELVLDLGLQPLANNLLRKDDLGKAEPRFPLRIFVCPKCWLLQITELVPPVQLFSEYLYFSSFSDSMLRHAREAANTYLREFSLGAKSMVIEIASNDGYLLQNFHKAGVPCLGIEPAANVASVAREKGIPVLSEFFGETLGKRLHAEGRSADLLLGNNVFAHVPYSNDFAAGIRALLKPDGICVLEFPYAADLIAKTEFDTIYHEHVYYFTLTALQPLVVRHGLEIFDVAHLPIHGGSLRILISHAGAKPIKSSVSELLGKESASGVSSRKYYEKFARDVEATRDQIVTLIRDLKKSGKKLAAYGASAKGSTLLNYCGLGPAELNFIADRSTYKQGRFAPGTHLPIVAPEMLLDQQPDYTLLLTWNFADEILQQQQEYRKRGGKFIIPIPNPAIV